MELTAGNIWTLIFIVVLVGWEWVYQKDKHGASEATNKMIFGFLAFGFCYGIVTVHYLVAGICLLFLIFQLRHMRKVAG